MATKQRKKKSLEIMWPSGVTWVKMDDKCLCVGENCKYRSVKLVHSDVLARVIREIVEYYGFPATTLPNCIPLNTEFVNDMIKEARKIMRLKGRLPRMIRSTDPIHADLINETLFRCLIKPMENKLEILHTVLTIPEREKKWKTKRMFHKSSSLET